MRFRLAAALLLLLATPMAGAAMYSETTLSLRCEASAGSALCAEIDPFEPLEFHGATQVAPDGVSWTKFISYQREPIEVEDEDAATDNPAEPKFRRISGWLDEKDVASLSATDPVLRWSGPAYLPWIAGDAFGDFEFSEHGGFNFSAGGDGYFESFSGQMHRAGPSLWGIADEDMVPIESPEPQTVCQHDACAKALVVVPLGRRAADAPEGILDLIVDAARRTNGFECKVGVRADAWRRIGNVWTTGQSEDIAFDAYSGRGEVCFVSFIARDRLMLTQFTDLNNIAAQKASWSRLLADWMDGSFGHYVSIASVPRKILTGIVCGNDAVALLPLASEHDEVKRSIEIALGAAPDADVVRLASELESRLPSQPREQTEWLVRVLKARVALAKERAGSRYEAAGACSWILTSDENPIAGE